ncbi:uncharacterized protein LOC133917572 [Phragmites australis]|uniref:uncharacterized protein LOC133917572 n=1 Tax=Phragmites australis TaxID=29695 RepID=UPI002D76E7CD|nr:uncharacterized protein LOC133917572 [Phragmites australis]
MVVWEPYTADFVLWRSAYHGISKLCFRDSVFWLTRKKLVFDVFIEDYATHRVMRQFGWCQEVLVPLGDRVPDSVHTLSTKGLPRSMADLTIRMQPCVQQWGDALAYVIEFGAPYDDYSYQQ